MALIATVKHPELLTLWDEQGRSYDIQCGWGVDPPVAWIPRKLIWKVSVPDWLYARRDEAIAALELAGHRVEEYQHVLPRHLRQREE